MEQKNQDDETIQGLQFQGKDFLRHLDIIKLDSTTFRVGFEDECKKEAQTQHHLNDKRHQLKKITKLSVSKQKPRSAEDICKKYISPKLKTKDVIQEFINNYQPDHSLQQNILMEKFQKAPYSKLKKIIKKASKNQIILTTSSLTKYLLEFFIITVIIQNLRKLTSNKLIKSMNNKRNIFKIIMKKQYQKLKSQVNYGYNCRNLKLLLQSDYIQNEMLKQSLLIDLIMKSKSSQKLKKYYVCFIPKLKQIRSMDKNQLFKQVWKKKDQRSIKWAHQIISFYEQKQKNKNSSVVQVQTLSKLSAGSRISKLQ